MSASACAQLRELVASLAGATVSARATETARMGILDCVGCIVGGSGEPAARKVRALAAAQGVVPEACVLGTSLRLSAPLAALANGVAGHVLDYDDMSSTLVGHPSVVLVPTTFALGQARGASGAAVIAAYVAGFEVASWFGRRMVPRHYDAGWHSTSSLGVLGAAAAAAHLLGLDADATLHALAIAASDAAGLRANFGSETKSLHAGRAAEGGMRAALLAQRGFTGNPVPVFDRAGGFFDAYGTNEQAKPRPPGLEIEATGIGLKPYACCGAGVALIDAALEVRGGERLDASRVASVECVVSEMAARIMPFPSAADGLQAKYCLAYCAAVALLDGRARLAEFDDARVRGDDVRTLMERVHVSPDARMAQGDGRFGVALTVRLHDGRTRSAALEVPRGHPERPLDTARQVAKFVECAAPVVGEAAARAAAERLQGLEALASLEPVIALLVTRGGQPA